MLYLCAGLGLGQQPASPNHQAGEYDVKAAYLLNFAKFVEWPEGELGNQETFGICILGEDPFGETLDQIVAGETVAGKRVVVQRIRRWQTSCRVLFVGRSEQDISSLLGGVGNGVLTVGDTEGFLRGGGMVNFVVEDRRVRFDINQRAVKRGALNISSRMLTVARRVQP